MTNQSEFWLKLRGERLAIEYAGQIADNYRVKSRDRDVEVYRGEDVEPFLHGRLVEGSFEPHVPNYVDGPEGTAWEQWFQSSPMWNRWTNLPTGTHKGVAHDTKEVIGAAARYSDALAASGRTR
jgi:hypothetical protein